VTGGEHAQASLSDAQNLVKWRTISTLLHLDRWEYFWDASCICWCGM